MLKVSVPFWRGNDEADELQFLKLAHRNLFICKTWPLHL